MSGFRLPKQRRILGVASLAAASLVLAGASSAQSRTGAPIKYKGQGGASYVSQPAAPRYATTTQNSRRTTTPTYTHRRATTQVYSTAGQGATSNPRTKRIEFRYPDEPNVVYSSNGTRTVDTSRPPIKYASKQSAMQVQQTRQYASVGTPTPIVRPANNPPVLDQPNYARPVIEEVAMADITAPSVRPAHGRSVGGLTVEPVAQAGYEQRGIASWYGDAYHGKPTANGETFDMTALTAAHPTLPLPSLVQVTNLANGREIVVRVNDRGPFVPHRMIDLSKRAAEDLDFLVDGEADVLVRYLGPAPVLQQAAAGQGGYAPAPTPAQTQLYGSASQTNVFAPIQQPRMDPIPNPVGPAFFIQAGSFSEMSNAERLSRELGGSLPVDVVLANVNGADFFRVLIGPYAERREATVIRDQLNANGIVNGVLITGQK